MPEFNLLREPWIRCVDLEGKPRSVGLAEVIQSAHELRAIVDESPLVVAALHRLILAILHRNLGPKDTETWGILWKQHQFPAEVFDSYWQKWESRFDLFHETHPFYQTASITKEDGPKPLSILEFHRASGNNATLFDHTVDDSWPAMTPFAAASALVAHQTFALSGTLGYLRGGESGETSADKSSNDAPSARGLFCIVQGGNLFETLLLNLAEYDPADYPSDLPNWENDQAQAKAQRQPSGRLDLFTWQSRRVRLFCRLNNSGETEVEKVILVAGLKVSDTWNPITEKDESLQCFGLNRIKSEKGKEQRPWYQPQMDADQAVWRNSNAILYGLQSEKKHQKQSLGLHWLAQLVADFELLQNFVCRIEVLGLSTEPGKNKIQLWRREQIPISAGILGDAHCKEALANALSCSDETAFALRKATEKLAAEILAPSLDQNKADPKRVKQLAESLGTERQYWSALGINFLQYLESLSDSQNLVDDEARYNQQDTALASWRQNVRDAAQNAFDQTASGSTQNGRGLRARALADNELRRSLWKLKEKSGGNTNNDQKGGTNE